MLIFLSSVGMASASVTTSAGVVGQSEYTFLNHIRTDNHLQTHCCGGCVKQPLFTDPSHLEGSMVIALLHLTTFHYSWSVITLQGAWRETTPLFYERIRTEDGWGQGLCLMPTLHLRRSSWRKIPFPSGNLQWNNGLEAFFSMLRQFLFLNMSQINQGA